MKKAISIIVCVALSLLCLTACNEQPVSAEVSLKYYAEASEMLPALKSGAIEIGLLPEPAASNLENKVTADKTWYRLDLQELYDSETKAYPQAVVMIKQSVLSTYKNITETLSAAIGENVSWVKENVSDAVSAVNAKLPEGVTPSLSAATITAKVIDNCKIYWQGAQAAKTDVKNYIDKILDVGGSLDVKPAKKTEDDFFADGTETGENASDTLTFYVPDGAPALAVAKLIYDQNDLGTGKTVEYGVVSANNIASYMQNGTADIIVIPVNAASKLYKAYSSDSYKMASVLTHGNLYILSTEKISLGDLNGKTVGVIGQGLVPDLTLKTVLKANSIEYKVAE